MIRACFAAAIAAACLVTSVWAQGPLAPQSALYKELMPHFRAFEPDLTALTVKDRRPIDATAEVIVVEARAPSPEPRAATAERQMRQDAFGVFVLDRATGRRRMTVDIFPTERRLDYVVKMHDVSASRLTIGRAGGTYGDVSDQVTYFWDLAAGKIVERLTHGYFAVTDVVEHEGHVWAVGSDGRRGAVMRFRPGDSTPLALVDRVEGRPIPPILETDSERDTLVLVGATTRYAWRAGRWDVSPNPEASRLQQGRLVAGVPFGLPEVTFWVAESLVRRHAVTIGARRFFVWSSAIDPNAHGGPPGPGIWQTDAARQFHPLPAPTYETFARLRPRRVNDGYTREQTHLHTEIGPFQVEGPRIWFGTTFYDGEGTSGIGGIGSFDVDARRWQLVHPSALVDWSCSAILVEPDVVWVGLVRHTEGRGPSGGLVRWDRGSGATKRVTVAPSITIIRRLAGRLYLGTTDGLFILDGARTTHVRVLPERGGALRADAASALDR